MGESIVRRLLGPLVVFLAVVFSAAAADTFEDRYEEIQPQEIADNVFKLVGQDFSLITAGPIPHHNSMTASFGGMGILFGDPVTWCFLRANRYTLEKMREDTIYTMSYLPEEYKEQLFLPGGASDRDGDKMQDVTLTPVTTPSGLATYEEARLVIECRMTAIVTVSPDDFLTKKGRDFVEDGYADAKDYHKIVFGEITKVWRKR